MKEQFEFTIERLAQKTNEYLETEGISIYKMSHDIEVDYKTARNILEGKNLNPTWIVIKKLTDYIGAGVKLEIEAENKY